MQAKLADRPSSVMQAGNGSQAAKRHQVEAIFFDVRDTLGVVDREGHLLKYKPTTDRLLEAMKQVVGLRIGLITNLPDHVAAEDGKAMVKEAGIWEYLDPAGWVTNRDAGVDKPEPEIFAFAAQQMGLPPEQCLFVGENLTEVIGAQAAGMRAVLKPFPPGREFPHRPTRALPPDGRSSGRLAELVLEEEHVVGKRIVEAAIKISERLDGDAAAVMSDAKLLRSMGLLVWLTEHFVDAFHHRKEEEVLIPFALARGFDPRECAWVGLEHDQGRTYFRGMDLALQRVRAGDTKALEDFAICTRGFVELYKVHGRKEDDELFARFGELLTNADDALVVELMGRIGPADVTLYLEAIAEMESDLDAGVRPAAGGSTLVRRYFEELLTAPGDLSVADEILAADVVFENPISRDPLRGIEEYKAFAFRWYRGFPDRKFVVDEMVEEGETVVARFTITGTHRGEFSGAAPTGNRIEVAGVNIFHTGNGRIRRVKAFFNPLHLWEPLGLAR
ncbi:MAG: hypothetical protein QOH66_2857 [Actinomycetota bacterium]|jgi:steroid delta-isomerase-like uncharacterized protein/HAD superfamily hydrolase (TIGR01509 family)|nr:hypothetical protein [Actinomycetota bacterium]